MEIKILQPKNCDFSKIQHQITQSADKVIDVATYPNGFVLTMTTTAGKINVENSSPLIKIDDATYQIPD